ncbi:MAG: hypothetical protein IJ725_04210, partial [Ruminococcus sp.]|nr:hypothetical protein [Ruminococcus sp.]
MKKKTVIAAVVMAVLLVPAVFAGCNIATNTGNDFIDRITGIVSQLSNGIWASLVLFALTLIFSMPIGLLVT